MDYKEDLVKALVVAERKNPTQRIRVPIDAVPAFMRKIGSKKQEHFAVMSLNGAHEIIAVTVVTKGLVNRTLVHPREVFREAIVKRAAAIIVAHNHPSGSVQPSNDDLNVMSAVREAGDVVGIRMLDFMIVSKTGFYSALAEEEL